MKIGTSFIAGPVSLCTIRTIQSRRRRDDRQRWSHRATIDAAGPRRDGDESRQRREEPPAHGM